jgi:membrane associated rhomboid family serine protease
MYRRSFTLRFPPGIGMPTAVKWLLLVNVVFFLAQQVFPQLTALLGLVPWKVLHEAALYQFVTYLFLHGGFFHLFFNMLMLWMFGRELEEVWGRKSFLKYYFLTGIGAGITSFLVGPDSHSVTIGASGAIMALLVAFALQNPDREVYLWFLFPIKIKYLVMFLIAFDLVAAVGSRPDGVARFAHLGGALIGFLYLKADWRLAEWGRRVRNYRYERRVKKVRQNSDRNRRMMDEVDRVLDRINEVGYDGLTREEKRILEEASEIMNRKQDS